MSIPNPYGQNPNPYGQNPNPYAPQQPPQAPQVPQPNPYQQAPGAVSPNPYAQQPAPGGQPLQPAGVPPQPGARRSVPGWLWAVGGAVVASAVWGGLLFTGTVGSGESSGTAGAEADFAGHAFQKDMCEVTGLEAFQKRYTLLESSEGARNQYASRQKGLDRSYCSRSLRDRDAGKDDLASTYVYSSAEWHKNTDPEGEFASRQRGYEDQSEDTYAYKTTAVDGIGDEAYLIAEQRGTDKDTVGGLTLAVREGHFTYEMRWSWFGGGPDDKADPPPAEEVEKMLTSDTKAVLAAMKKS
ncbi:hypothetical protein DSC45_15745 [Streptomyces sp. YIM 130001]|uniref:hypothetical protein n=1 Tax=Streptomyces sp. YIM 130001 TaxID=2259644 RepID=UPI000E645E4D|nr:hypothetical protein [Streptomyces sp. YIM 130001]RII16040.1 hypothetical protein DSC45_15745 [Streptomyces sp. YIM 130001]